MSEVPVQTPSLTIRIATEAKKGSSWYTIIGLIIFLAMIILDFFPFLDFFAQLLFGTIISSFKWIMLVVSLLAVLYGFRSHQSNWGKLIWIGLFLYLLFSQIIPLIMGVGLVLAL